MSVITPGEVKGLFRQLVRAIGSNDAAGAHMDPPVSPQRISQLCTVNCPDMPTLAQVLALEQALGKSVVFAALADRVSGVGRKADPMKEVGDVMVAGADLFDAVRRGEPARVVAGKYARLEREVSEAGQAIAASDEPTD